ncbi:hypothetical protein CR513_23322, partial [Mucuna pruriens]
MKGVINPPKFMEMEEVEAILVEQMKGVGRLGIAYAHVPNQGRSKLHDRSMKIVFIGYDANSKGYKLYNPNNGKIIISKDVEFDEEDV